jgi:hypothetical protein
MASHHSPFPAKRRAIPSPRQPVVLRPTKFTERTLFSLGLSYDFGHLILRSLLEKFVTQPGSNKKCPPCEESQSGGWGDLIPRLPKKETASEFELGVYSEFQLMGSIPLIDPPFDEKRKIRRPSS